MQGYIPTYWSLSKFSSDPWPTEWSRGRGAWVTILFQSSVFSRVWRQTLWSSKPPAEGHLSFCARGTQLRGVTDKNKKVIILLKMILLLLVVISSSPWYHEEILKTMLLHVLSPEQGLGNTSPLICGHCTGSLSPSGLSAKLVSQLAGALSPVNHRGSHQGEKQTSVYLLVIH